MELAVHVNGSLETAGRRVAYFSRLIDEYCPATIHQETSIRIHDYIAVVPSAENKSVEEPAMSPAATARADELDLETTQAS
jgi:hypothetical protein